MFFNVDNITSERNESYPYSLTQSRTFLLHIRLHLRNSWYHWLRMNMKPDYPCMHTNAHTL